MEESVRLQYLEAMGIDVWVPRHLPVAITPVLEDESNDAGWAEQCEAHHAHAASEISATPETPDRWASLHSTQPAHQEAIHPSHPRHSDDQAWKDLQQQVSLCRACGLCETRTQTVFGVGNKHADWMLIGEAPGRDEDLQGEPFVGRAGQLLNEMIRAIGLQREQVYIANMLKCRPPNNRDPQAVEVDACHAFLQRQIGLIQPKIILAVGRIAAQNLLHTTQPLAKLRGHQHSLENIPLVVVHHPAYLLRSLTEKAKAWDDLQFALSVYQSLEH